MKLFLPSARATNYLLIVGFCSLGYALYLRYLAIEQLRFEERLRVHYAVAPETATYVLPPFVLQTLVENALKFGVAPFENGGDYAGVYVFKVGTPDGQIALNAVRCALAQIERGLQAQEVRQSVR